MYFLILLVSYFSAAVIKYYTKSNPEKGLFWVMVPEGVSTMVRRT